MPALALAADVDELTLRRARRGDERAWRELVERYQRPIHALVWRLLSGRAAHRVPDLVQETFVRVLRALDDFDPSGPATLSTWMLTIATRLSLNELRRIQPVRIDLEDAQLAAADRTDAGAERARLGDAIARAMAKLPDAQRAILVLRELHDLDHDELAAILEIEPGTVKSRLSRARAALREHLTAMGVDHA